MEESDCTTVVPCSGIHKSYQADAHQALHFINRSVGVTQMFTAWNIFPEI